MNKEITIKDVFTVLVKFAENTEMRFDKLETDVSLLKTDVSTLKTDVYIIKNDVFLLKTDVSLLNSQIVTKSYLDYKIADLREDMEQMVDRKIRHAIAR